MKYIQHTILLMSVIIMLSLASCQSPGGESPGSEFMPDMAHSIAYEANYYNYYYNNTWGSEEEYYAFAQPKLPVKGTVPRSANVGSVPYYYGNTEEERTRATNELIDNPLPITDAGLASSKELYNTYCGICHGEKGDGGGYLVRDDGGKYPVQPANFLLDEFVGASNGRYYHAIMHGKNLMGAYSDKLSHDERWNVIHYIRSLQAKEKKLTYNQLSNTLNSVDRPAGEIAVVEEVEMHDAHGHDQHNGHHDHHSHPGEGNHEHHDHDGNDDTHHDEQDHDSHGDHNDHHH